MKTVPDRPKQGKRWPDGRNAGKTMAEWPKRLTRDQRHPATRVTAATVENGQNAGKTLLARPKRWDNGGQTAETGGNSQT